jgi:hypothetical protein
MGQFDTITNSPVLGNTLHHLIQYHHILTNYSNSAKHH